MDSLKKKQLLLLARCKSARPQFVRTFLVSSYNRPPFIVYLHLQAELNINAKKNRQKNKRYHFHLLESNVSGETYYIRDFCGLKMGFPPYFTKASQKIQMGNVQKQTNKKHVSSEDRKIICGVCNAANIGPTQHCTNHLQG